MFRSQWEEATKRTRHSLKDMEEVSGDEVIPGRLQQVSERAWEKDGDAREEGEEEMDGELWGSLQDHIPLHLVWEKLPCEEHSRLRAVCKAWNRSALQRLEAKPYFVTIALVDSPEEAYPVYMNELVRYDVASRELSFKRHAPLAPGPMDCTPPFAVDGLVFCYRGDGRAGVYNLHTRAWHEVPDPLLTRFSDPSVLGMLVDTSERPYSFRLVMGCTEIKTQIYDSRSRSWSIATSVLMDKATNALVEWMSYSCMCHDDCIYVCLNTEHFERYMILMYSLKEDRWSELALLPSVVMEADNNTLGVWDGRIFAARAHCWAEKVSVWELVDAKKQQWAEYASSPEDLKNILVRTVNIQSGEYIELLCFFCDEYILVCNWRTDFHRLDTLVMLNLRTKNWELVGNGNNVTRE